MILKAGSGTLTANEELLDRALAHASLLERLKESEVRRIVGMLNRDVLPDLIDRLRARLERINLRGFDGDQLRTQRFQDLIDGIQAILREGLRTVRDEHTTQLVEVAQHESRWQAQALSRSITIEAEFQLPSVATLRSIVTARPFQGHLLKDWWDELGKNTAKRVRGQITIGLAEGQDVDAIVRRIRGTQALGYRDGILQTTRREAETVVRTAVQHVTAHAREETIRENEDLVKGVQMVATLDTRTSPFCQQIDGKVFKVGEGPRPPFHPNCRTQSVPVLKSWKELGLKGLPEGTRASMDGQVPESTTYLDWITKQSAERQDAALGPARAALLRSGKFTAEELRRIGPSGRPLTLAELAKLEAA